MKAKRATPKSIDDYVATFPNEVQETLGMVRASIRKAAPKAEEAISYQIPAFKLNGRYHHLRSRVQEAHRPLSFAQGGCGIQGGDSALSLRQGLSAIAVGRADSFRPDPQDGEVQRKGKFGMGKGERKEKEEGMTA